MATAPKHRLPGVTVVAVLCVVAGAYYASTTLIGGARVLHPLAALLLNPLAGMMVIVGLAISLAQAGLVVVIGIGLFKLRNWARVLSIVLMGLGVLLGAGSVVTSVANTFASFPGPALILITVCASALAYLFKPRVKEVFGAGRF